MSRLTGGKFAISGTIVAISLNPHDIAVCVVQANRPIGRTVWAQVERHGLLKCAVQKMRC